MGYFEVRDNTGSIIGDRRPTLRKAKDDCDAYAAHDKEWNNSKNSPYAVFHVEQVWTSSTLDEAVGAAMTEVAKRKTVGN
jgi:hypothetical protein